MGPLCNGEKAARKRQGSLELNHGTAVPSARRFAIANSRNERVHCPFTHALNSNQTFRVPAVGSVRMHDGAVGASVPDRSELVHVVDLCAVDASIKARKWTFQLARWGEYASD